LSIGLLGEQASARTLPAEQTTMAERESSAAASGQTPAKADAASLGAAYIKSPKALTREFLRDQKRIWSSPAKLRERDLRWMLPAAGVASMLFASDERTMRERIRSNAVLQNRSGRVADLGLASLASIPAFLSWYGWRHNDEYAEETATLSARAAVDSLVAVELLKLVTLRERPPQGNGGGRFLQAGPNDSSFPSTHAALAWAMAPVIAERYPGWMTKTAVYGLATAVSFSRVTGQQHFPSDVAIGSALGWAIGHFVAQTAHTRPALRFSHGEPMPLQTETSDDTAHAGSSYVPMDSWVYQSLDRLAAFGLIPSQTAGLRPWTREECQRQMREADERLDDLAQDGNSAIAEVASPLLTALHREFGGQAEGRPAVVLDSVYMRNGVIAGPALTDSFHFGQTWSNDFGRPFGRGWNSIEGFTTRAESGRFFAFVQGEYQHAPGTDPYSLQTRQLIAGLDANPVQAAEPSKSTDRFRAIEAYAGVRVGDFELSVGKQDLYWGPTFDAPLSFSNNAEPTKNGKISMVHPVRLPGLLRYFGAIRGEFVMGKLGGQQYTWRPWFSAQKLSFKLTENLEMGFTRWSILWGVGHPITVGSFIDNLTSTVSLNGPAGEGRNDPGDRKAGFDFRYRVPGLRNWLTLYSDTYSDDDPSPLAAPRRAAFSPGLYLTRVPGIAHLDFRVEAASTTPYKGDQGGTFIYYNNQYHSGNTNYGYLLGNPVGRDGRAIEGWARYWFTPRSKVEAGYRQAKIGGVFLPGGGTQSDATLKASLPLSENCFADVAFQYERYWIPSLGGPKRNLSGSLQLRWEPKLSLLH
jgi:membrane-associated phospholipid phosphatase